MTYEKTNWITGDIITAEKLNKIENGIEDASGGSGSSPLIVNLNLDKDHMIYSLDRTWRDIHTALSEGRPAFVLETSAISDPSSPGSEFGSAKLSLITATEYEKNESESYSQYTVVSSRMTFETSDPDGYPMNDGK